MPYPLCRHIKANGIRCQSPSLSSHSFCYFHSRLLRRHTPFRHTPETRGYLVPGQHIELIPLEDRESVQVAISVVINALATGQLDPKRATALLYGLQLASSNSARLRPDLNAPDTVRSVHTTPDGLDLAERGIPLDPAELANRPQLGDGSPATLEAGPGPASPAGD